MTKWVMGILGTVIAGVLVYWLTIGIDGPPRTKPTGIYKPKDGAQVSQKVAVEGWYSRTDENLDLWLVVQPIQSPHYHPQPGPIPKDKDSHWRSVIYIGGPGKSNIGEEFLVYLMTTTAPASQAFKKYLNDSAIKDEWIGMQFLPEGANSIDSIKVVRK